MTFLSVVVLVIVTIAVAIIVVPLSLPPLERKASLGEGWPDPFPPIPLPFPTMPWGPGAHACSRASGDSLVTSIHAEAGGGGPGLAHWELSC